jgi:hypothetical protein
LETQRWTFFINRLFLNNWIQTGNIRTTFRVLFSGHQLLHGSYGGVNGLSVGTEDIVEYGFYHINACPQSPFVMQYQTNTPIRREPVDGNFVINLDIYSNVLGRGKSHGIFSRTPDENNPGKYRLVARVVHAFLAN